MGKSPIDAVVAGSKSFALALFAPLTERVGVRPRIASDATHAAALLPREGGLAVVEYQGDDTLRAIEALLRRPGLRVVAAVPPSHAGAEERLRALGVAAAAWDGAPGEVLGAVARLIATAASAAPPPVGSPTARSRSVAETTNGAPVAAGARVGSPPAAVVAAPVAPPGRDPSPARVPAAAPASAAALERRPSPALTPAPAQPPAWPSNGPAPRELEDALARGLAGLFDVESALRGVTEQVVQGLSPLERDVLSGVATPVDADTLRRAALMRLEVAAALAAAPPPGSPVDAGAVSALLAQIDALLSRVGALAPSASPDVQASLEAIRNALVKEAIDFSEAAQRLAPAEALAAPTVRAAVARTRLLAVEPRAEKDARRRRALSLALVASLLVGGAYHGLRIAGRDEPIARTTVPGAPADSVALPGRAGARGMTVVRSVDGRAFTPEEIAILAQHEQLAGNTVRELAPGVLVIVPPGAQPAASLPQGR